MQEISIDDYQEQIDDLSWLNCDADIYMLFAVCRCKTCEIAAHYHTMMRAEEESILSATINDLTIGKYTSALANYLEFEKNWFGYQNPTSLDRPDCCKIVKSLLVLLVEINKKPQISKHYK